MSAEEILDDLIESVVTETAVQLHRWIKTGGLPNFASSSSSSSSDSLDRRSLYPDLYPTDESLQQDLDRFVVEQPPPKRMRMEIATTTAVLRSADGARIVNPDTTAGAELSDPTTSETTPSLERLVVPQEEQQQQSQPPNETLEEQASSSSTCEAATTLSNVDPVDTLVLPEPATSTTTTPAADTVPSTAVPSSTAVLLVGPQQQPSVVVVARNHNNTDIWGRTPAKEPGSLIACSVCRNQVSGLRFASHLDKCLGIGTMSRNASSHGSRKS